MTQDSTSEALEVLVWGVLPLMVKCPRDEDCEGCSECKAIAIPIARAMENRLRAEGLREFMECCEYDALMSGPKFKSYNRSALDRLRLKYEPLYRADALEKEGK